MGGHRHDSTVMFLSGRYPIVAGSSDSGSRQCRVKFNVQVFAVASALSLGRLHIERASHSILDLEPWDRDERWKAK